MISYSYTPRGGWRNAPAGRRKKGMVTMFRPMRRAAQALPEEECLAILARGEDGVLAVVGDEGYPYAVPLNYVYREGKIYLHCAKEGHKIDAIRREPKVSFCVVDAREVVPEAYSTAYRSVIVFGRARVIDDPDELTGLLDDLAVRFVADGPEARAAYIQRYLAHVAMIEISVLHMTGKEGSLLHKKRLADTHQAL